MSRANCLGMEEANMNRVSFQLLTTWPHGHAAAGTYTMAWCPSGTVSTIWASTHQQHSSFFTVCFASSLMLILHALLLLLLLAASSPPPPLPTPHPHLLLPLLAASPSPHLTRCQDSTSRVSIKFRAAEGKPGLLTAYPIPQNPPKVRTIQSPACMRGCNGGSKLGSGRW
jgi:hypothetical protein